MSRAHFTSFVPSALVNRLLARESSLTLHGVAFLVDTMIEDLSEMFDDLGNRLGAPAFSVDMKGLEIIEDMASNICLACYLIQGKRSVERTIEQFAENPVMPIPDKALIKLERLT